LYGAAFKGLLPPVPEFVPSVRRPQPKQLPVDELPEANETKLG
jgi:hypothetical protein